MTELSLLLLLLFHSTLSTPWPQSVGIGELFVFIFLMIFLIRSFLACLYCDVPLLRNFLVVTCFFWLFTFALCSLIGAFNPLFNIRDYIRDAIPSFFVVFMPLTAYTIYIALRKRSLQDLLLLLAFLGSILCLRGLQETGFDVAQLGVRGFYEGQSYKQYDPIVIFSAFSSCSLGFVFFQEAKYIKAFSSFIFFLIMIVSFFSVVLRQALVFALLSPFSLININMIFLFSKRLMISKKALFTVSAFLVFAFFISVEWGMYLNDVLNSLISQITQKTLLYGLDAKSGEFLEVFNIANTSLGTGFGAPYYNQTNGFLATFTHSVLSYPLLKGSYPNGILWFLYFCYVMFLFRYVFGNSFRFYWRRPLLRLLLAAFMMLLLVSLFQVVYKPITFSIICGFCLGALVYVREQDSICRFKVYQK